MTDTEVKYEWVLQTWGGFYNKHYQEQHKEVPGYQWFETEAQLIKEVDRLRRLERDYREQDRVTGTTSTCCLVTDVNEGYDTRLMTTLNVIVQYRGKTWHITRDMGYGYPTSAAEYHMEWKWDSNYWIDGSWVDDAATECKVLDSWINKYPKPYNPC